MTSAIDDVRSGRVGALEEMIVKELIQAYPEAKRNFYAGGLDRVPSPEGVANHMLYGSEWAKGAGKGAEQWLANTVDRTDLVDEFWTTFTRLASASEPKWIPTLCRDLIDRPRDLPGLWIADVVFCRLQSTHPESPATP